MHGRLGNLSRDCPLNKTRNRFRSTVIPEHNTAGIGFNPVNLLCQRKHFFLKHCQFLLNLLLSLQRLRRLLGLLKKLHSI